MEYRSGEALGRLLDSLGPEAPHEVIVVDNGGDAEVPEGVTLISPGENRGYGAGNNLGAAQATGDALVFLNPDTVVTSGALAGLVAPLEDPSVGIVTARLRLLDRPETLNSAGNEVHVTGIAWAGGYGEPAESVSELRDVAFPTGAAMAIRRDLFEELGGFTEELFLYQEDLELGWRVRLRGLRVVVNPAADVLHDYDFRRHAAKHYLLERNRLVFVLSSFSPRLLVLLAPVLASVEVGMLALALKEGWAGDKVRGWGWLLRNAGWLRRHRQETQRLRRVRDRDLARFLSPVVAPAMIPVPGPVRAANSLIARYWALVRKAL
ncbi:MAG TPA: glycosyltransferase family 2 protein [Gaiellaceae bacterium]|nr:glycosyltransferase family 2 protein [Gaiellaceae bacterium]